MQQNQEAIRKLGGLIKGIKFAMLTTLDDEGHLRSRPMATEQASLDEGLWFFTQADSPKVGELKHDSRVNVSYADSEGNRYVSVSGRVQLVNDRSKAKELWSPLLKTWFPNGPEDPNLLLLKVELEQAEFWNQPAGRMEVLFNFMKTVVTGKPQKGSSGNEKLDLTG